jgi:signal transduction histidine kinase
VLGATIGGEGQQAFLSMPEHMADQVQAFIVCAGGRPLSVSHAHAPVDYTQRLPSPLVDLPPGSVATYVNYEGISVIGTSRPIRGAPWTYIAEESVESAFGELRGLRLLSAALEAVFALALVGIVWVVAGTIVSPLRHLVGAAQRIRAGDLEANVLVDRRDELGELGSTFNEMAEGLRASAEEIRDLHDQDMRRAAQLASVGELAAGIAHEIKNPLAGASSGIDLLEQHLNQGQPPGRVLSQVRAQLRRIDQAIRDLLSYARPKEPRVGHVAPELLIDRVITLVRPQAEAVGVRLERSINTAERRVQVDPELLTQALVNLALNGIQAMESGGVLTMGTEQAGDEVRITVSDTGTGLRATEIEEIFRPFFTTKHRGTGLGLAITRSIVERHGGRLEVESTPGRGSCFALILSTVEEEWEL